MDELDRFWALHFDEPPSSLEHVLIWRFSKSMGVEDPIFALIVMLIRNLHETLGSTEKGIFENGPALGAQMEMLSDGLEHLCLRMKDVVDQLAKLSAISVRLIEAHQQKDGVTLKPDGRSFRIG